MWVEPLREWILDTKQADLLANNPDFHKMKLFVQKIGTNPTVRDKSVCFGAPVPSEFVAKRRRFLPHSAPQAKASGFISEAEVSFGGEGGIRTPGRLPFNGFQDRRFRPLSHLSSAHHCTVLFVFHLH